MSARGEVFLGDLAKALSLLRPRDRRTAAAMADVLGLGPGRVDGAVLADAEPEFEDAAARPPSRLYGASGETPSGQQGVPAHGSSGSRPGGTGRSRTYDDGRPVPDSASTPVAGPELQSAFRADHGPVAPFAPWMPAESTGGHAPLADRPVDFSLSPAEPPPDDRRPGFLADAEPSTGRSPDGAGRPAALPSYEPPWTPDWARGVMFGAVATPVASRRLDEHTLSRKMARQEGLRAVPWQCRLSTRRGVQLLLDHGAGMVPFQDDRRWLRELAGSIAGRDRVEVLRFRGTPLRGVVRSDPADPQPYRPPAPGTPVVLVSDLGRARPPFAGDPAVPPRDWEDFGHRLLRSGCPAVCLTPFPAADYPRALRARIALIPFDRRISLAHAREATRRIHQAMEVRS